MKILEDYKKIMQEFINEAEDDASGRIDMDDPLMQKKGWYKDNPELTIGGVLKQGEKHPAYKDAKQLVDKEKGKDSGEDDSKKLSGKSDFSRDGGDDRDAQNQKDADAWADKMFGAEKDKVMGKADEPKSDDKYEPNRNNADNAKKELADISTDLETHEGDIPKSVKRQVDQHTQDIMAQQGIYKNDDGQFATDDGKVLSSDSVHNILSRETGRTENEIGYMLDKAGLSRDAQNQKDADDWASKMFGAEKDKVMGKSDDSKPKDEVPSTYSSDELESISFKAGDEEADDIADEISDEVIGHFSEYGENEENANIARDAAEEIYNRYQNPQGVAPSQRNMKAYRDSLIRDIEHKINIAKTKKNPKSNLKKSKGTMGSVGVREPGQAGSGMYDSVQPKKKPFLKEQLERIGGGRY